MSASVSDLCTSANFDFGIFKGDNRSLAVALVNIIGELREYWPLTVRQVYYQAVARLLIPNRQNEYRRVSRNLATLRRHDAVPWHAIEDRTRRTIDKRGVPNVREFIKDQMKDFLHPQSYGRCYIQNQELYVEVATEKDALSAILEDAVWMYCTRLNVVRGQVSATMVNAMAERFDKAIMRGKDPVLLYLGDFDYSGVAIPKALQRNLCDWHSVDVELVRVALNPDQIADYNLPEDPEAGKSADPNRGAFLAEYGDVAPVELDALHPGDLGAITRAALESVYDMSGVADQKAEEQRERSLLATMRRRVEDVLYSEYAEIMR